MTLGILASAVLLLLFATVFAYCHRVSVDRSLKKAGYLTWFYAPTVEGTNLIDRWKAWGARDIEYRIEQRGERFQVIIGEELPSPMISVNDAIFFPTYDAAQGFCEGVNLPIQEEDTPLHLPRTDYRVPMPPVKPARSDSTIINTDHWHAPIERSYK